MTLGRTASNAIKIKTDGTTRAVECACCAPPCECPDSPWSPFVPPIDGTFEVSASWSSTVYQFPYNKCGIVQAVLADGTDLSVIWQCSGRWNIYALNFDPNLPNCCQNLFGAVFDLSPVGTFQLFGCFPSEPACENRFVTITEVL